LKFGIGNCIPRNSDIGSAIKATEEDVFTPVQSSDHYDPSQNNTYLPSIGVVFIDVEHFAVLGNYLIWSG
jgi:hypothetical protein